MHGHALARDRDRDRAFVAVVGIGDDRDLAVAIAGLGLHRDPRGIGTRLPAAPVMSADADDGAAASGVEAARRRPGDLELARRRFLSDIGVLIADGDRAAPSRGIAVGRDAIGDGAVALARGAGGDRDPAHVARRGPRALARHRDGERAAAAGGGEARR
jgi:hypothetical protein